MTLQKLQPFKSNDPPKATTLQSKDPPNITTLQK